MKDVSGARLPLSPPAPSRRHTIAAWILGVLALGGLIGVVLHIGELERFAELAHQARVEWLIPAVAAQGLTYVVVALAWRATLIRAGHPRSLRSLIPLGLAKLFTDQALPSGGLSGSVFVTFALERCAVPAHTAVGVLIVGLVSFNLAYALAVVSSVLLLRFHDRSEPALLAVVTAFSFFALGLPVAILCLKRWARGALAQWIGRLHLPTILFEAISKAPIGLLKSPSLMVQTFACQVALFLLDAATLWFAFQAIAVDCPFWIAFVAFVMASVAATVTPIPLGVGTFEAAAVTLLGLLGIPLEAALTAILLLRGLTFWLPMLPGLWLARRAMHRRGPA